MREKDLAILIRYHKGEEMSNADMAIVKGLIHPEVDKEAYPRLCPLTEALHLTTGPRQEAYGHPAINFANIAMGWTVILNTAVLPQQVALCMIWTKVCRETNMPAFDNEVDIAGYVNTLHMIKERK